MSLKDAVALRISAHNQALAEVRKQVKDHEKLDNDWYKETAGDSTPETRTQRLYTVGKLQAWGYVLGILKDLEKEEA